MRIVFVSAPLRDYTNNKKKKYKTVPPLGLGYLATVVQNAGHNVKLIDGEALGLSPSKIVQQITEFKPDYACFTVLSPTFCLIKKIISKLDGVKVIVGGSHATIEPEKVLKKTNAYALVRGEGEVTFKELVEKGRQVNGISYIKNGKIIHNPDRPLIKDLDSLPFIDRSFFINDCIAGKAVILGSRGCPHKCTFCSVAGKKLKERSVKNIVDEIELLSRKYGVNNIQFIENNFALNQQRVIDFLQELDERSLKIKWRILARADTIARFDESVIEDMAKNGCYHISFGLESGSQRILNLMKKGITLKESRKAISVCKKYGISTKAYFIVGWPTETLEEVQNTMRFSEELKPDIACFLLARAYPGTQLYKDLIQKGYKNLDSYDHLDEVLPERETKMYRFIKYQLGNKTNISIIEASKLKQLVGDAYKKFYGGSKNENILSIQV